MYRGDRAKCCNHRARHSTIDRWCHRAQSGGAFLCRPCREGWWRPLTRPSSPTPPYMTASPSISPRATRRCAVTCLGAGLGCSLVLCTVSGCSWIYRPGQFMKAVVAAVLNTNAKVLSMARARDANMRPEQKGSNTCIKIMRCFKESNKDDRRVRRRILCEGNIGHASLYRSTYTV